MNNMNSLDGRTALVTNINHFVGLAAARALAANGASVVCHDREFTDADVRSAFEATHAGYIASPAQEPAELVATTERDNGAIDILVSNDAFPAIRASVENANLADLRAGFEEMVVAPFALIGAAVPAMKARKAGKIILVTSAAPLRGLPNYSMYAATRGAANSLAISLARELARDNIQVNAVAPNYVESPSYFPAELLEDEVARGKILKNIPLGRLGKPDEVGALIAFLASPGGDFMTAQVIPVAGGWA